MKILEGRSLTELQPPEDLPGCAVRLEINATSINILYLYGKNDGGIMLS